MTGSGKVIASRMKKHQIMKGFASAVAKMKTVSEDDLQHSLPDYIPGNLITSLFKEEKEMDFTLEDFRNLIYERTDTVLSELKASHKYKIGDFVVELTKDNQVDIKKAGKLVKTVDVSPSYDTRDLAKLADKLAKKEKKEAHPMK